MFFEQVMCQAVPFQRMIYLQEICDKGEYVMVNIFVVIAQV